MRKAVAGVLLALGLGCGGLWQEVLAQGFSDLTVDLQERVPATDPHAGEVLTLIEDGWIAAWEGHLGMSDTLPFEIAFHESTVDGRVDEGELVLLKERAKAFDDHPVDAERRAELMKLKQSMDDKVRAERGVPPPEVAPEGELAAVLEAAGWTVTSCSDDGTRCEGTSDGRLAVVSGGDAVVYDLAAAEALRDRLIPEGAHLADLEVDALRAAFEGSGFALEGCEEAREGPMVGVECSASLGPTKARASLQLQRGGRGRQARDVHGGAARVLQGKSVASVTVEDTAAGAALVEALTR